MANSDIIHLCTSLKKLSYGKSIKLPGEVHHIIMLPINRIIGGYMKKKATTCRMFFVAAILVQALFAHSLAGHPGPFLSQDYAQAEKVDVTALPGNGSLFSAILFADTPLGERWGKVRPEAETLFPHLKLKAVPDLHVTIAYIGKEWNVEKLALIRQTASLPMWGRIRLVPEIAYFGRKNRVIAVELKGLPEEWRERIVGMKRKLNEAGLKSPEASDSSFRAHVTLAEAKNMPPTEEEVRELEAFRQWIVLQLDFPTLEVVLDPTMPIQWLLADAPRPTPIPEYITVESYLLKK